MPRDPVDSITAWLQSAPPEVRDKIIGDLHTPSSAAHPGRKQAKSDVNYRSADVENETCGDCSHFQDGGCELVAGNIKPDYVCDLYSPKDGSDDSASSADASEE